jgi:arginyl-tRNA synthetase
MAKVRSLFASGAIDGSIPDRVSVERPKNRDHGDFATSVALQLAKSAGIPPREIAQVLATAFAQIDGVEKAEIAGPGFINLTLVSGAQSAIVKTVLDKGKKYGEGNLLADLKINLEFISANPTGPLHLGHTRWAAVGDAMARVLSAAGAKVTREFYINDRGNQMDLFGASLAASAHGLPIPENGYHGEYIKDLAKEVVAQNPEIIKLSGDDSLVAFREAGYKLQLAQQQGVLNNFGSIFDVWYSERKLHDSGAVANVAEKLKKNGHVYEDAGATWLRTTDLVMTKIEY